MSTDFEQIQEVRQGRMLFVKRKRVSASEPTPGTPEFQVVFVHGLLGTQSQYDRVLRALDINADCLLYDWIGCGQSPVMDKADDYNKDESVADLVALLKLLAPTVPVIMIGHSYGPSIILPALREVPSLKLAGMVWISTALKSEAMALPDGGHPIMKLPTFLLNCLQRKMTEEFIRVAVVPDRVDIQEVVRRDSNMNHMWVAKCYHQKMVFGHIDQAPDGIPHLIIHGADDHIVPVKAGQDLANRLTRVQKFVVVDNASHMVILEQPETVANAIRGFVSSIET